MEIREGYTEICSDAFLGCSTLTSVSLPDSLTIIGEGAFRGCKALTDVTLPSHLKEPKMLAAAFKGTPFGESIKRENSVVVTEQAEFIPNGDGTWSLAKYTDTGSVALIRSQQDGKRITRILGGAFAGRTDIVSVFIGEGITEILPNAFCGCLRLSFAALPKILRELHSGCFGGCKGLSRVLMPAELKATPHNYRLTQVVLGWAAVIGKRFAYSLAPLGQQRKRRVCAFARRRLRLTPSCFLAYFPPAVTRLNALRYRRTPQVVQSDEKSS